MKTIEERAREWVDQQGAGSVHPYNRRAMIDAYVAAYEELTQWNDPKKVFPKMGERVLVKISWNDDTPVYVGKWDELCGWLFCPSENPIPANIVGWREIH